MYNKVMDGYIEYLKKKVAGEPVSDEEESFYAKYQEDEDFYSDYGYYPDDSFQENDDSENITRIDELPNDYTDEEIVEAAFDDAMFDVASGSFHVSGRDVSHSPRVDVSKLTPEQYELYDTEYQSHYGLSDDGN